MKENRIAGRILQVILSAGLFAFLATLYDLVAAAISREISPKEFMAPITLLTHLGISFLIGGILLACWSGLAAAVNAVLRERRPFFKLAATRAAFGVFFLSIIFVIFKTDHQPHRYTTLFMAALVAAVVVLQGGMIFMERKVRAEPDVMDLMLLGALSPFAIGFESIHKRRGIVQPLVLIFFIFIIANWDHLVFRFAGLHISGFHRMLNTLTYLMLLALCLKVMSGIRLPRIVTIVMVFLFAASAVFGAVRGLTSASTRAAIINNGPLGEAIFLLFQKPWIGGRKGRLPGAGGGPDRPLKAYLASGRKRAMPLARPVKNLWIIIADTLRYDYLPCNLGRTDPVSALLKTRFSCFENTRTPGSATHLAIPALLEGRYIRAGMKNGFMKAFARGKASLKAVAFLMNMKRHFGFGTYSKLKVYPPSWTDIVRISKEELQGVHDKPHIFFAHFLDIHLPSWYPPRLFKTGGGELKRNCEQNINKLMRGINELFNIADRWDLWKNTAIILTSDHGEEFYERGYYAHGYNLYETLIKVPLWIYVPGMKKRVVGEDVSLLDIAPTMADLMGKVAPGYLEGSSLVPLLAAKGASAKPTARRYFFSRGVLSDKFAVIHGGYKLIWDRERLTEELHHLRTDPLELRNLIDSRAHTAANLKNALRAFVREYGRELSDDIIKRSAARTR